ncbi:MAG: crotonase/enoyl-CoA hydratase family protein [Pseudomonadales bacterium]
MSCVLLKKEGHLATLTLNRPDNMNALGQMTDGDDFVAVCDDINADSNIRCAILTGSGRAFSAGGDLKAMQERTGGFAGGAADIREGYKKGIHKIIKSLWNLEVPMVAAINGHAVGLGNDIATTADIRIASAKAKFGATFVSIGLVPGDGGAWLLPRSIGRSRAAELFFTGDLIDADTALDWGLVSYVCPPEEVMDRALVVAAKIMAKPPLPTRMTKRMMREGDNGTLDNILEMAASMQAIMHGTEDHAIAVDAVLNKKGAEYSGR